MRELWMAIFFSCLTVIFWTGLAIWISLAASTLQADSLNYGIRTESQIKAEITRIQNLNIQMEKEHPDIWAPYPGRPGDDNMDVFMKNMEHQKILMKCCEIHNTRVAYIDGLLWALGNNAHTNKKLLGF